MAITLTIAKGAFNGSIVNKFGSSEKKHIFMLYVIICSKSFKKINIKSCLNNTRIELNRRGISDNFTFPYMNTLFVYFNIVGTKNNTFSTQYLMKKIKDCTLHSSLRNRMTKLYKTLKPY